MNKTKYDFSPQDEEVVLLKYQGTTISISTSLSLSEKGVLIDLYLSNYLNSDISMSGDFSRFDYIGAETALILALLDMKTSIDVKDESFNIDGFTQTGLWERIHQSISNYEQFRKELDRVVQDAKDEIVLKNSIGSVLESLFEKAFSIMNDISNSVSEENVEKATLAAKELMNELKKSPLVDIYLDKSKETLSKSTKKKLVH